MTQDARIKQCRTRIGISQAKLGEMMGCDQSTVAYWEIGRSSPDAKKTAKLAKILRVTPEWLMFGDNAAAPPNPVQIPIANYTSRGIKDLPIRGMAQASRHNALLLTGDAVSYIDRPAHLIGNPTAFAVWVAGKSMTPRFHPGETLYINPAKPVTDGCYVLLELNDGSGFIKQLIRHNADKAIVRQLQPEKDLEIDACDIKNIFRVVGSWEGQ